MSWETPAVSWDAARPIPWKRLAREGLIFLVVAGLAFAFVVRADRVATYAGLVIGAALYVVLGAVLAKFGYQRQSFAELRAQSRSRQAARRPQGAGAATPRPRPAPTKRTGGQRRR